MPRGVYKRKPDTKSRARPVGKLPALAASYINPRPPEFNIAKVMTEPAQPAPADNDFAAVALVGAFMHWFEQADLAERRRVLKALIDTVR